jgi:hypothetical protein
MDLGSFEIYLPKDWKYVPEEGEDSYIGSFYRDTIKLLSFDYSRHGYSSPLIPNVKEYLREYDYEWKPQCPFCEPYVAYTRKEHIQYFKDHMDPKDSLIDVRESIHPKQKIQKIRGQMRVKFPNADYLCTLTHKDSSILVPIIIPEYIKQHHIKKFSLIFYHKKTIYPRFGYQGLTGLYIKNRITPLTFCISGFGLSIDDQKKALKAFKTIRFKK